MGPAGRGCVHPLGLFLDLGSPSQSGGHTGVVVGPGMLWNLSVAEDADHRARRRSSPVSFDVSCHTFRAFDDRDGTMGFARSVYLGAQEKLPLEEMEDVTKERDSATKSKPVVKNHNQEKHVKETFQTCKTDLEVPADTDEVHEDLVDSFDTETTQGKRLSKAERRRLRKQQRRQNKAA